MATGYDNNIRKPSFFICTAKVEGKEWRAGYNTWGENSCVIGVDGKEYHGTKVLLFMH